MAAGATTWASSLPNIVGNLLHGATVDASALGGCRSITLPTLHFSMAALVEAMAQVHGTWVVRALVSHAPQARIEQLFGRFPPLDTPRARAAGFLPDLDLRALVRSALATGSAVDPGNGAGGNELA